MARSHIKVRPAGEADVADLAVLWGALKRCGALGHFSAGGDADDEPVRRLLARPDIRILVAFIGERAVGMTVLSTTDVGPLTDLEDRSCVQIDYTIVAEQFRRRGVGRALINAAAAYAEEIGADQVTVSVSPLSREANRFFAQLGLTPLTLRRVAPATALRRRIAILERAASPALGGPRRVLVRTRRPAMRTALRRIAIASPLADQPRDL